MMFTRKMEKTLPVLVVSTGLLFTHSALSQEEAVDNRANIYGGVSWFDLDDERDLRDNISGAAYSLDEDVGYVIGGEVPVSPRWSLTLENWGAELDHEFNTGDTDAMYTRFGGNYHLNKIGAFQPYLALGIGHMDLSPDMGPGRGQNRNETAVDLGVGAKTFLSEHWMLRADVKALYSDHDDLDYLAGLSIGYVFGNRAAPAPIPAPEPEPEMDSDGDGVPDSRDECPNTPSNLAVDSSGCPILETHQEQQVLEVTFSFDSAEVQREFADDISEFAQFMQTYSNTNVVIEGHTDNTGPEEYNQGLSERRAEAVRQELINEGISASRISAVGYGESRPVTSNDTREGRAQNRRIEAEVSVTIETEVTRDQQ